MRKKKNLNNTIINNELLIIKIKERRKNEIILQLRNIIPTYQIIEENKYCTKIIINNNYIILNNYNIYYRIRNSSKIRTKISKSHGYIFCSYNFSTFDF